MQIRKLNINSRVLFKAKRSQEYVNSKPTQMESQILGDTWYALQFVPHIKHKSPPTQFYSAREGWFARLCILGYIAGCEHRIHKVPNKKYNLL